MTWTRAIKLTLACLCIVSGVACSKRPGTSNQPRPIPPDHSLTVDAYLDKGMPAIDRSWTGQELAAAGRIIKKIANDSGKKLPRYNSSQSGDVFARMTSKSNFKFYENSWSPVELRFADGLAGSQGAAEILKLYIAANTKNEVGAMELIELLGLSLRYSKVAIKLTNEFIPSLDKTASDYSVRMDGLAQMKRGLATQVSGCLLSLTERHIYRPVEMKRLIVHMQDTLPDIIPNLTQQSQTEFINKLKAFDSDPSMNDLDPELHELVMKVVP